MKKVEFGVKTGPTINCYDVGEDETVYAREFVSGKQVAIVVKDKRGWITLRPNGIGSSGHYDTKAACMENDKEFYDFYVE